MSQGVPSVTNHEGGPVILARVDMQVWEHCGLGSRGGWVEFLWEGTTKVECWSACVGNKPGCYDCGWRSVNNTLVSLLWFQAGSVTTLPLAVSSSFSELCLNLVWKPRGTIRQGSVPQQTRTRSNWAILEINISVAIIIVNSNFHRLSDWSIDSLHHYFIWKQFFECLLPVRHWDYPQGLVEKSSALLMV